MFNKRHAWTVLLLLVYATDGSSGSFPAHTGIDCTTGKPFEYGSADEGYSGTIEYIETPLGVNLTLQSPSCPVCLSFLELSHATGNVYATVNTKDALDAEALREYQGYLNYSVVCTDNGVINNRTLQLNDINDNAPVFEKDVYKTEVSEFLPLGSVVIQVKATDADASPEFNSVTYTIIPPSETFNISTDGLIMLKRQLNHAMTSSHRFSVVATDTGGLDGSSAVVINVTTEVDISDIVKIFINKPSNMVIEQVHETERALERGLELLVMIREVVSSDANALVSFIARQNSGTIVPPEDVKSDLRDNKQKVRTELQEVFGPDTDFWIAGEGLSAGEIVGIVFGTITCVLVPVGAFMFYRSYVKLAKE